VGIGQASPASKLDIQGGLTVGNTYSGTNAAPANGAIFEGKVGIGKANASYQLDVAGDIDWSGDLQGGTDWSDLDIQKTDVGKSDVGLGNVRNVDLNNAAGSYLSYNTSSEQYNVNAGNMDWGDLSISKSDVSPSDVGLETLSPGSGLTGSGYDGTSSQSWDVDWGNANDLNSSGNVTAIRGNSVSTTAPSNGEVLKWNGSDWVPGSDGNTDADADPNNEIQDISTDGTSGDISISNGSNLTLNVDDADANATNEYQDISGSGFSTNTLTIDIQNGSPETVDLSSLDDNTDADANPNNEIQNLGYNNGSPSLSNYETHKVTIDGSGSNTTIRDYYDPDTDTDVDGCNGCLDIGTEVFDPGGLSDGDDYAANTDNQNLSDVLNVGNSAGSKDINMNSNQIVDASNVGIGTTSPDHNLDVDGVNLDNSGGSWTAAVRVQDPDGDKLYMDGDEINAGIGGDASDDALYLQNETDLDIEMVKGGGNVAIGSDDPSDKLEIYPDQNQRGLHVEGDFNQGGNNILKTLQVNNKGHDQTSKYRAIQGVSRGSDDTDGRAAGIFGKASGRNMNIGVYGGLINTSDGGTGIYGSDGSSFTTLTSNNYAGYFDGDVGIKGDIEDNNGNTGSSGEVLTSTTGGVEWQAGNNTDNQDLDDVLAQGNTIDNSGNTDIDFQSNGDIVSVNDINVSSMSSNNGSSPINITQSIKVTDSDDLAIEVDGYNTGDAYLGANGGNIPNVMSSGDEVSVAAVATGGGGDEYAIVGYSADAAGRFEHDNNSNIVEIVNDNAAVDIQSGAIRDNNGNTGSSGDVLTATGSGVEWQSSSGGGNNEWNRVGPDFVTTVDNGDSVLVGDENGSHANYAYDFAVYNGSATGTKIGLGSVESLVDESSRTTIDDDFSPAADVLYDLGTSNEQWQDIYSLNFRVSGEIYDNNGNTGSSGEVLTSTSGGVQWQSSSGGGDDLGDHIADQNLDMDGNNIDMNGQGYVTFANTDGDYYLGGGNTPDANSSGVHLEAGSNPSGGDPLFVVESSGGSERLRVEHSGALNTSNTLEVDGSGVSYIAGAVIVGQSSTYADEDLDVKDADGNGTATLQIGTEELWDDGTNILRTGSHLHVERDLELDSGIEDNNGNTGSSGEVLTSTGGGVEWQSSSGGGGGGESGKRLYQPFSSSFPSGWTRSSSSDVEMNNGCSGSTGNSLQVNGASSAVAETRSIDLSDASKVEVSYLYRQGDNSNCGNNPESGDNINVDYWDGSTWVNLANYDGSSAPNTFTQETFTITSGLSSDFRIRFDMVNGTGNSYDNFNFEDIELETYQAL